MIYVGPDTDWPGRRFQIDRAYDAHEILSEDPQAFFHVWQFKGSKNNILFAVVRRPENVHLKAAGFTFQLLQNGRFICTGLGISDYYTWNESQDVRLADCLDVIHGTQKTSGSVIDALEGLERFDLESESDGTSEMQYSDTGDWVSFEDVLQIIEQLRMGDIGL